MSHGRPGHGPFTERTGNRSTGTNVLDSRNE